MTATISKIPTWLPVFPGFYNTIFDAQFDGALEDLKENNELPDTADEGDLLYGWDNTSYEHAVVSRICKTLATGRYFPDDAGIVRCELERIVSPKEYNFTNDSANVVFEIDMSTFAPWIRAFLKENDATWTEHLRRHYRSRDGFISYYPDNPTEWQVYIDALLDAKPWPEEEGWRSRGIPQEHLLGRLLEFYLITAHTDPVEMLYYDVNDHVYVGQFIDVEKVKQKLKDKE